MTTYTSGAILTVRRPDGQTEDVVNTQHARNGVIPAAVFCADGGCYKKSRTGRHHQPAAERCCRAA